MGRTCSVGHWEIIEPTWTHFHSGSCTIRKGNRVGIGSINVIHIMWGGWADSSAQGLQVPQQKPELQKTSKKWMRWSWGASWWRWNRGWQRRLRLRDKLQSHWQWLKQKHPDCHVLGCYKRNVFFQFGLFMQIWKYISIHPSIYLSIHLSIYLCIYLSIYLSILKRLMALLQELLPVRAFSLCLSGLDSMPILKRLMALLQELLPVRAFSLCLSGLDSMPNAGPSVGTSNPMCMTDMLGHVVT